MALDPSFFGESPSTNHVFHFSAVLLLAGKDNVPEGNWSGLPEVEGIQPAVAPRFRRTSIPATKRPSKRCKNMCLFHRLSLELLNRSQRARVLSIWRKTIPSLAESR